MGVETDLLKSYTLTVDKAAACRPGKAPLVATAYLQQDIHEVFPYLHTVLQVIGFVKNPPAMIIKQDGRQIALEPGKIIISDIVEESEVEAIVSWFVGVINDVWRRHSTLKPSYLSQRAPRVMDIVAWLPKSNCSACGEASCMAFAVKMVKGEVSAHDCPSMTSEERKKVEAYLQALTTAKNG